MLILIKRVLLLSLFLILTFCMFSQDIITKSSGEKIKCKITSIDTTNIYYTITRNGHEIDTCISKSIVQYAQYGETVAESLSSKNIKAKNSLTIGILEGGGSLFGFDIEYLLTRRLGIQAGAGIVGFGGGINFHLSPAINSTFISLLYCHQGFGVSYTQSLITPCFIFRANKWFTAQLGLGFVLEKGSAWPSSIEQEPIILTYAIGVYIPW